MSKKSEQYKKAELHCHKLACLSAIVKEELDYHTQYCHRSSENSEKCLPQPSAPGSAETSFVEVNPSFFGYLHAICVLLCKAFSHKKSDNFIAIG